MSVSKYIEAAFHLHFCFLLFCLTFYVSIGPNIQKGWIGNLWKYLTIFGIDQFWSIYIIELAILFWSGQSTWVALDVEGRMSGLYFSLSFSSGYFSPRRGCPMFIEKIIIWGDQLWLYIMVFLNYRFLKYYKG